jgi:twinkle protein
VEETKVAMFLVSHLKRPEGRGHEEGAQTSLSHLRGSHAISQLSDAVLGLERDQQGDEANVTTVRVLKNRYTGDTGIACRLEYSKETGRLSESAFPDEFNPGEDND